MSEYEVVRTHGRCFATDRAFEEGEAFHSVIVETPTGFERRDYCDEAWTGAPDDAICHFRTRMQHKAPRKKTFVDDTVLMTFFDRLRDATEPAKQRFRFVLALILLRKRLLRYENSRREGDGEVWIMRRTGDRSRHEIFNPGLSEDEIGEITAQLGSVLHADLAEAEAEDEVDGGAESECASQDTATEEASGDVASEEACR